MLVVVTSASCLQTSGEALYTSDLGMDGSGLHAAPVLSSQALATLDHIDPSKALKVITIRALFQAASCMRFL